VENIMDLIGMVLTLIFATIVVCMLIDFEVKHKKDLYFMGVFLTLMIVIDSFVWTNFGYETFMKLYTLLAQIPLFIAFLFVSKYKGIKLVFVHLTVIALVSSMVLIAILISSFFGLSLASMYVICLILYIPTGFIIYKYLRPYILYMLRNIDKGWLAFCIIPLTYSILTYSSGKYNLGDIISETSLVASIRGLIFTFISYILILWLFKQNREQLTLQNEQNLLKMQITASKQNLEALKESQEKTIVYRHDMRHHLNLINAYLADDNKEAAQNYITGVEKIIDSVTVETYCSNYSLNLIMNFYITKAKEEHIDVKTHIELPSELAISDMDLCLVFSNAIENAINALAQIQNTEDKILEILCKTKNDKLLIKITNSFEGTVTLVDEIPISKLENHGFGTKSIAAISEKYNGVVSFMVENGVFAIKIIL
jgi:hypothetical protein